MFWMATILCLLLLQAGGNPRTLWLTIGALAGLGLLTKPSMLFFLVALLAALLLTPERRLLRSPWLAAATALTLAIIAPFLLWELHNGWPTWEFLRNGQLQHKTIILGPLGFLWAQFGQLNPATAFLWIPGIVAPFFVPILKPYRWISLTYLLFLALMFALHAKDYYLAPIYPMLFAAGAVAWGSRRLRTEQSRERLIGFPILESALVLTGLLILPMSYTRPPPLHLGPLHPHPPPRPQRAGGQQGQHPPPIFRGPLRLDPAHRDRRQQLPRAPARRPATRLHLRQQLWRSRCA